MGNGMNKVLPGLYLGSFRDGKDSEQLRVNKITHIVSIHDTAKEVVEDKQYLCIRVPDSPDENLTKYFYRCNDFIHGARMTGGNVLVHCLAGVSRSATIAVAYIMSVTSLNCKDALKVVRGARNIANPNYGFHSQLKEFETYCLTSERKRLKVRYSAFDNQKSDEEECAKMITVYHNNIPSSSNSTPTHRRNSKPSSMPPSPSHRFSKPASTPSSSQSTPMHRYSYSMPSTLPSSSNYSSTRRDSKPSTSSATNSPLSSPIHRLFQRKNRSASSSPKKS